MAAAWTGVMVGKPNWVSIILRVDSAVSKQGKSRWGSKFYLKEVDLGQSSAQHELH